MWVEDAVWILFGIFVIILAGYLNNVFGVIVGFFIVMIDLVGALVFEDNEEEGD